METIYRELPEDIQADINNMYHKEVPFKDEVVEYGALFHYYQSFKKDHGKGFIEKDWYGLPEVEEEVQDFWHLLESHNNHHHSLLILKMDVPKPEEWNTMSPCDKGAVYCNMVDQWEWEKDFEGDDEE